MGRAEGRSGRPTAGLGGHQGWGSLVMVTVRTALLEPHKGAGGEGKWLNPEAGQLLGGLVSYTGFEHLFSFPSSLIWKLFRFSFQEQVLSFFFCLSLGEGHGYCQ